MNWAAGFQAFLGTVVLPLALVVLLLRWIWGRVKRAVVNSGVGDFDAYELEQLFQARESSQEHRDWLDGYEFGWTQGYEAGRTAYLSGD